MALTFNCRDEPVSRRAICRWGQFNNQELVKEWNERGELRDESGYDSQASSTESTSHLETREATKNKNWTSREEEKEKERRRQEKRPSFEDHQCPWSHVALAPRHVNSFFNWSATSLLVVFTWSRISFSSTFIFISRVEHDWRFTDLSLELCLLVKPSHALLHFDQWVENVS